MRKGLVTTEWLANRIHSGRKALSILDASWYLPMMKRNAWEEYQAKRIQGARYFDLDKRFSDLSSPFPHMLPSVEVFKREISRLGIKPNDEVIIYDGHGIFSSARCLWMFHVMGWNQDSTAVLDGGLPKFEREFPDLIDTSTWQDPPTTNPQPDYPLTFRNDLLRNLDQIVANIQTQQEVIVDARPAGRFTGEQPEPRPIPSGHIPHSLSIPATEVLDQGKLKSQQELEAIFRKAGVVDNNQPIVCSCGSGVTASILYLALNALGVNKPVSVYDGSWSEYADPSNGARDIRTSK